MSPESAPDRTVFAVTGKDAMAFLQGLVSNDLAPLAKAPGLVWTGLLTPQGKYLADFFVLRTPDGLQQDTLLLDMKTSIAEATQRRLMMYRLRADVQIATADIPVSRGLAQMPDTAYADPRHAALGWRAYGVAGQTPSIDWDALRVAHCIPETGIELIPDDGYLLELGFDRLHGVDFRKGCYVGQEVTARMKHKTEIRKGLVTVRIDGTAPVGAPILSGEKPSGTLFTQSGGQAIAYLRFDRLDGPLTAGSAHIAPLKRT